ncbi:MAG: hypothetical protein B7C24_11475 [Bacteroidetes bacterium 4572_77]|nr:MAG: hypothetical protein B7C24_11475 [Bacteroidetes bacterium 4572_77]
MKFLKKYSITFQLFLFISFLMTMIFFVSSVFMYNYQEKFITKQNNDYINNHLENFVSRLDVTYKSMQIEVEEGINIAEMVFYRNYSGNIRIHTDKKISYDAVNQITHDTNKVWVNSWTLDGQEIHNNYEIVDKIKKMGPATVTIFQKIEDGYLRISTNVITKAGRRAVGTFIPNESEVIKTIEKGNRYQGRAYVVDDWYTTIYDPIYINGEIKGILYVGEKESAINMFKRESKSERYLGDGYAFVMSNNTKFNGLMLMHPTLEGINLRTSGNIEYLELYNELISDFTQKEETETSRIVRMKNKVRMKSDRDQLAISFNNMAKQLYDFEDKHQHQLMMRKAENDLFERTRFANDMDIFGQNALRSIANYLPIQVGCFYYYHEAEELLTCQSSIGISDKTNFRNIKLGEGLIGEVAARKIEVKEVEDIPKDFYKLKTGIGECDLKQLIIIPLVLNDNLLGVIEIASVNIFS